MNRQLRAQRFQILKKEFLNLNYMYLSYSKAEVISSLEGVSVLSNLSPKVTFLQQDVLSVIPEYNNPTVLVFCSAKNPGGGVENGSIAQEESISLHSTWYFQVRDLDNFYLNKGDSAVNTDKLIYVERGYLLKDNYFNDINPIPLSFIGSTAVNLKGLSDQGVDISKFNYQSIMNYRIHNILTLAEIYKKEVLILGAFGCGIFGLDPYTIAKIFMHKIKERIFTGSIVFAIPDDKNFKIFQQTFEKLIIDKY